MRDTAFQCACAIHIKSASALASLSLMRIVMSRYEQEKSACRLNQAVYVDPESGILAYGSYTMYQIGAHRQDHTRMAHIKGP